MPLDRVLSAIEALHDLPHLVAALGHEPSWEELDPGRWLAGLNFPAAATRVAVVGRAGGFPWFGLEANDPAFPRRVARRLEHRGSPAGVIGLAPAGRRLTLAVAWDRVPALSLDLDAPDRIALAALARLAAVPARGVLALAAGIAESLAIEDVGRRFFVEFRAALDRMAGAVRGPARADDRRTLALVQLTRVLFLYFIQRKGWLNGDESFLAHRVNDCLLHRRDLHRQLFQPLFFGTLNRPFARRGRAAAGFGRIPFLNGGLFEPHPLERRWRVELPNDAWRDAFDHLFERFHFTVDERDPADGVAPDMLGRVFEGVMTPDVRRASGTFYTPARLVRQLVDAALCALVASRLNCGGAEAERRLANADPAALRVLTSLTLLDPAVGSGAFLLGALDRLAALRAGSGRASPELKRAILQHNLFGVDLDPAAVRLTELRLWLAVVADDTTRNPERVTPLPNLDCLVRQGDSLLDPVTTVAGAPSLSATNAGIGELRRRLIGAVGAEKSRLVRELRRVELAALREQLDAAAARVGSDIAACVADARSPTLFERRRGIDAELRQRLFMLRRTWRRLRDARRRLTRGEELPWFHYQSQFADVFARGGFDLVIGNPPWVRSEELSPAVRARLAERYRWWRTGNRRGYRNRPDLSLAFLERGWELAAPGGVLALLLPAKLLTAGYGAIARHAIATGATIRVIADLTGNRAAAFDATVYPMALVAHKATPPPGHRVRTGLERVYRLGPRQSDLAGGGPWILLPDSHREALAAVRGDHPTLGERLTCHLGAKTGANPVFLDPPDVEPEVLRWAVRGRDIVPFRSRARVRLLWPHAADGSPLQALPPRAAAHVQRHRELLRRRADYDGGPIWTVFRTGPATATHRIVWADLARQLSVVALAGPDAARLIPLNTCYVAPAGSAAEALGVAAWLNSTWLRAAARAGATPAASGFVRFTAATISALPLPEAAVTSGALCAVTAAAMQGKSVQEDLDAIAADILGLSERVRRTLRALVGIGPGNRR